MRWMIAVLQDLVADPLMDQPIRRRLVALIRREPGIHASKICRDTGHPWGTVQYHLRLLQQSQMITSHEGTRERRFFPDGIDARRAGMLAVLREGRREDIARLIQDQPGLRQVDLCRAAAVSRKTFRSSVNALIDAGLVAEARGLQENRYFPAQDLASLLHARPGRDALAGPGIPDGPDVA